MRIYACLLACSLAMMSVGGKGVLQQHKYREDHCTWVVQHVEKETHRVRGCVHVCASWESACVLMHALTRMWVGGWVGSAAAAQLQKPLAQTEH